MQSTCFAVRASRNCNVSISAPEVPAIDSATLVYLKRLFLEYDSTAPLFQESVHLLNR